MIEHRVVKNRFEAESNFPTTAIHETMRPEIVASFAMVLIEKWGMVAAIDDGEDSAGRAKIRLATPAEVVDRAAEVASLAMTEFEARGWISHLPTIEAMQREIAERSKTRETESA